MHKIPKDLQKVLSLNTDIFSAWQKVTPLGRNEWICWITSAKKEETRAKRLERAKEELRLGKRRPCCWAGCPHRD
jgi:uncharacterized protein YdeI (YjbR/CyaY-like superfamily)